MNQEGLIKGCIVDGPFALDNAIGKESAKIKGIESPVAGDAYPTYTRYRSWKYPIYILALRKGKSAGIILGAKAPIVLTSRQMMKMPS